MTRRTLFAALAGAPLMAKIPAVPEPPPLRVMVPKLGDIKWDPAGSLPSIHSVIIYNPYREYILGLNQTELTFTGRINENGGIDLIEQE